MSTDSERFNQRYRRRRSLGSGAMGEVWLADDLLLGRLVAIKTIQPASPGAFGADAIGRMLREARVAARLNHPNAVSVFDLLIVDGRPHVVMEYVDGESLAERLSRVTALPPTDAAAVFEQVSAALAAAHAMDIVHRDIKPANIMLTRNDVAKLADFGIARMVGDSTLTQSGMVIGTPAYLAPEVARGGEATAAADIWALGVALYAAVEGTTPFVRPGDNTLATLARVMHEGPAPPRAAGPLTALLMRMLDPSPASRPSAVRVRDELAQRGRLFAASQPEVADTTQVRTAVAEPPTRRSRTPAQTAPTERLGSEAPTLGRKRRSAVVWAAAGVIAVAVLAGVLAVVLTQHRSSAGTGLAASERSHTAAPTLAATASSRSTPVPRTSAAGQHSTSAAVPPVNTATVRADRSPGTGEHGTSGPAPVLTPARMISFVNGYYSLLPDDLPQAWTLLGPDLQRQGYKSYVDWWSRFDSVRVAALDANPARRTVTIKLSARLASGGQVHSDTERLSLITTSDGRGLLIDGSKTVS